MRLAATITILLLAVPLSGCIGAEEPSSSLEQQSAPEANPRIQTPQGTANGTDALVFEGADLASDDRERIPLHLNLPEDYWADRDGALEVSVRAAGDGGVFEATVLGPEDGTLARSQWAYYAGTLLLDEPSAGNYTVEVQATSGSGPYEAAIQLEARPAPGQTPRDLLPNLITMPPLDLAIERPTAGPDVPVAEGCTPYEVVEEQARRCLRFTNTVANLGTGALEVRLSFEQGALAAADAGTFVQRIYQDDGSYREEPVAGAAFHATHAHWHYEEFAAFELYRYDAATGERGDLVREQRKSGFCFFDMGLPELEHVGTSPPVYADEANCFTQPEDDWVTGLSAGWYDMYWSSLDDQYIDVSGLEDGTYELVIEADAEGSLIQASSEDDRAGAVIELAGDEVRVLERWSEGTDTWTTP